MHQLEGELGNCFKSLKNRWQYKKLKNEEIISELADEILPRPIAEIMCKRGLCSQSDIAEFLETPLRNLHSPFLMKDMDIAASRIADAVVNGENICIYGDYDVDGVTSVALMYLFLSESGAKVSHYIPNRLEEGYGLNLEAIDEIYKKGCTLLITVDCGINADEQVAHGAELGMDVIITDHHQPDETLPERAVAVVNPMRKDCEYPFKELAGVGVAFKLIMALRYELRARGHFKNEPPNIKKYLDIVTLGTVADVVPLKGENRIFVRHGLKLLSSRKSRPGVLELKKVSGVTGNAVTTGNVGFALAPRINAVGRLGSSDKGFRLLVTDSSSEAKNLALELDQENKSRQEIEREIIAQSYEYIEKNELNDKYQGLVLYSDSWHLGVIGIVASRVVDRYYKPTIVITDDSGVGKGSARSIKGFHLYDGLKEMQELLVSFGGHKYAAGLKIETGNIEALQEDFHRIVSRNLSGDDFIPLIEIDSMVKPEEIDAELLRWMESLQPFGAGNPEPVFCMTGVDKYQDFTFVGKDQNHLKGQVIREGRIFDCIGFNMPEYGELVRKNNKFDIVFSAVLNGWYNGRHIQLNLKDIKASEDRWD